VFWAIAAPVSPNVAVNTAICVQCVAGMVWSLLYKRTPILPSGLSAACRSDPHSFVGVREG
jgi:hypothetical protein